MSDTPEGTPIVDTDPEPTAASARWRDPLVLVGLAGIVVALGIGFGMFLFRSDPDPQPAAAPLAAVDTATESVAGQWPPADAQAPSMPGVQPIDDLSKLPSGPVERFEIVYFHRTNRCTSCLRAEARVRQTLDTYYADKLQSGEIVLLVEDVEQPADSALVQKYGAFGPSLYFGVDKGGVSHTYADNDIWFSADDDEKFMESLRGKIDSVLAGQ